jgi:hypothetical protein
VDEYTVYKYFSKMGYRVRRKTERLPKPAYERSEEEEELIEEDLKASSEREDVTEMDLDPETADLQKEVEEIVNFDNREDLAYQLNLNLGQGVTIRSKEEQRRLKRKASEPLARVSEGNESDDGSGSSVVSMRDTIVENDSDCEFVEAVENEGRVGVSIGDCSMSSGDELELEDTMEEEEPVAGPSSAFRSGHQSSYFVDEADSDSDLEIVDEVYHSHHGVGIEEIGYDADTETLNESGGKSFK